AGGNRFTVQGVKVARNVVILDLGASMNLTPDATLGFTYSGQFGSGVSDQSLKANLSVKF
ncbi:autotransporter outer membrane beta-barrel domain-containing protein, partial [Hoeflea sp. AS60]|uniref:autotransporter outer membrane beta-barrel domain-containing protein n=1 Tax=Hoeflea sp. AS60 TaxID=3135780 RepID=UPI0031811F71